jgi:hypothetical protein
MAEDFETMAVGRLNSLDPTKTKVTKTYRSIYINYIKWLQSNYNNPGFNLKNEETEHGIIFITQQNVERYFQQVVVNKHLNRNSCMRIFQGLNSVLRNIESNLTRKLEKNDYIEQKCDKQHQNYIEKCASKNIDVDPHKGLKDKMSHDEKLSIIQTIYTSRRESLDIAYSFLIGINAGTRGCSSRQFTLSDLNLSYGFGPESIAPRNKTLLFVLRKGSFSKENFSSEHQVGVQRHRDFRLCAVFATAALVISKLRTIGNTLDFIKIKGVPCSWWDIKLNVFETLEAESHAMREVLKNSGVEYCGKITHHRLQAVQEAGSNDLNGEQISTFTKHINDKLHQSYVPEANKVAMKVMSGFEKVSIIFLVILAFCNTFFLTFND